MIITENSKKWSQIISEELGVQDKSKLNWMSTYAQNHEVFEGLQTASPDPAAGIYATPLNTLGMGNPMMPNVAQNAADFHSHSYVKGSGDIPMSTLTMSLEVAAMTIGLELVPVVPMNGPWAMLSYMDTPYAGGKLGRVNETALDGKGDKDANKPIYIKFYVAGVDKTKVKKDDVVKVGDFTGKFIGFSRIDNSVIVKVVSCKDENQSIAEAFAAATSVTVGSNAAITVEAGSVRADLVSGAADHVQGFANFFDGADDPMTRAQNETGVGNTIGARMFTKLIQAGSYEVTGTVTRQQLQDMPLYGVDVIGKVLEAMQNEISQSINNRILDRLFKLGVTNAKVQKEYQNLDLNLYFGATLAEKDLAKFPSAAKFVGIDGKNAAENWGMVKNATQNTAAENSFTHQRRISSRILAAANVIAQVSRWGRGNFVVANAQILSALQDCAGFVVAPMVNTLVQDGSKSLYFAGSIAGLNVYVDPYMTWDDTRVLVGRKGDANSPGVVFCPYILADTVQITAEGTMAPKLLVNSRYALVDFGFHPEQNYITFMVDSDGAYLL